VAPAAATATTTATAALLEILFRRDSAQLQSFCHIRGNFLVQAIKGILGIEEIADHGIFQHAIAHGTESSGIFLTDLHSLMLHLVELLPPLSDLNVNLPGLVIGEESLDSLGVAGELRLVEDGATQDQGLVENGIFFGSGNHQPF
jgi:hypothetical protein